ncbi:tetratricopeptide repeat protein [Deinococcus roseus]|uniref:Tetratricopeptide repeat protein n=1 Tax=Deinococcus roseus TaxID=392414 RepID=A0ABQ2CXG7_9DEIO|nr:tetratricopeptide repeat protein [Deinococcus roseus]GGJ30481.1 hypothetical protein GCM10008938_15690 [Deinococcus roseus]
MRNLRRVLLTALLTVPVLGLQLSSAQSTDLTVLETQYTQNPSLENSVLLGQAYLNAGRTSDAVKAFEEAIRKDYSSYEAHFGLGVALFQLNNLSGAEFEFQQLTALNPNLIQGYYNLGAVLSKQGKTDDALASYQKAIEVGKANAASTEELTLAYTQWAQLLASTGKHAEAQKAFEEALKLNPQSEFLMLGVAQEALAVSKTSPDPLASTVSLGYAYQILAKNPAQADATLVLVENYVGQGLTDRAIRELDKGIAAAQDNTSRVKLLSRKAELQETISLKDALSTYAEVLSLDSQSPVKYEYARLLLASKQYQAAQKHFQELVAQAPSDVVYLGLAQTNEGLKQYAPAYNNALSAAKLSKDVALQSAARTLAARNAYRTKNYALVIKTVQAIQNPGAEALSWSGLSAFNLKNYALAAEQLEAAQKLDAQNQALALNLGAAYIALKRYDDAERVLAALVAANERNAEAWYNYGIALRGQGDESSAKLAFQKALKLGYTKAKGALGGK